MLPMKKLCTCRLECRHEIPVCDQGEGKKKNYDDSYL